MCRCADHGRHDDRAGAVILVQSRIILIRVAFWSPLILARIRSLSLARLIMISSRYKYVLINGKVAFGEGTYYANALAGKVLAG
jgi:hypothetical protein